MQYTCHPTASLKLVEREFHRVNKIIEKNKDRKIAIFANEYFILIATKPLYVNEISIQLEEIGIPHLSSDSFIATILYKKAVSFAKTLDDDLSRS